VKKRIFEFRVEYQSVELLVVGVTMIRKSSSSKQRERGKKSEFYDKIARIRIINYIVENIHAKECSTNDE